MIKKFNLIIFSLFLASIIFIFPCFADNDIDMNINNSETSSTNNTISNSSVTNNSSPSAYNTSYTTNSATVSNINKNDDEFGLTNILNIMLVVIGILLILLAIAILIRLKH